MPGVQIKHRAYKAPRLGAALAYYTTFSLAPLLVIVIAIAALVFGQEAVQGKIVAEIGGLSVSSPGYGRYVTAALSFVAGMAIGARRRAIFLTLLVSVLHKSRVRKEAYATVRRQDREAMVTPERGAIQTRTSAEPPTR
jgi:hypothetical protein